MIMKKIFTFFALAMLSLSVSAFNVVYDLEGCTADPSNETTVTDEDNELDLYFDLLEGYDWTGTQVEVRIGETVLDAESDYLVDVEDGQYDVYIYLIGTTFTDDVTVSVKAKKGSVIVRPTVFAAADFENIELAENSVYRPAEFSEGHNLWLSGSFIFNTYMGSATYFSDVQAVNYLGSYTPAGSEEYLQSAAAGAAQGKNYAVWNASMDMNTWEANNQQVDLCVPTTLTGMAVTCDRHAINSITLGDAYCRKFAQDDWYMLKIIGWKDGVQTGYVDFYLADYRTPGNWYYVENWQWVELASLGEVDHLSFEMYSTDSSMWGMNTPAYFCFDNLGGNKADCTLGAVTKVPATATENVEAAIKATKRLENGQLIIIRDGKNYNVMGANL